MGEPSQGTFSEMDERSGIDAPEAAPSPAPKVSIGLAVYNGEQYLDEAISSILSQTFEDFELVICDNASVDSTAEICARFAASDERIRYYRNP
jgi:glycosyltransferase involved in cell wall biosynthesis